MKIVKVMGLDEISIEVWKYLDDAGVAWLTNLFSKILSVNKMSSELRRNTLILIYKNKGDVQNCTNHCGIKFMTQIGKFWESDST